MRLHVLRRGPIDNPLARVPLVHVQTGDLFHTLAGKHDELDRARVGGVHRHVRALQPAIKLHKLVLVEPARTLHLRLGRDAGGWIERDAEAPG